jgi:hypothetical protein
MVPPLNSKRKTTMIVSYYDKHGYVRNKTVNTWTQAIMLASRKALDERCCPVIIVSDEGHVLYQVNK